MHLGETDAFTLVARPFQMHSRPPPEVVSATGFESVSLGCIYTCMWINPYAGIIL